MDFASIPNDIWENVANCLTGVDLLALVLVNRWTREFFSQDQFWDWRLSFEERKRAAEAQSNIVSNADGVEEEAPSRLSAHQVYVRAFSLKFQGVRKNQLPTRGSCAQVTSFFDAFAGRKELSFDVWFCLLGDHDGNTDSDNDMYHGGILFGGQSPSYSSHYWVYWDGSHQQFAVVSSDLKLYCSVVDEKPEITAELELHRWYHLALAYGNRTQKVYLNGQLLSVLEGDLHREWWAFRYAQIGTGCVVDSALNFPEPGMTVWYPFNGLIDDFRVWKSELSGDEVQALAHGDAALPQQGSLYYSLKRDLIASPPKNTTLVGCSRPREKVVIPSSCCELHTSNATTSAAE